MLIVVSGGLSGCALSVSDPRARTPITGFVALPADARIQVEPGFEAYGARVAALLPGAMAAVEAAHTLPFVQPPVIHVCGTPECFKRWVRTPKVSAAVVPDNRVFLSPQLDAREKSRLAPLLRHELSHLHFGQRIGHYHASLPVWFHEGFASLVADGGGAEFATDAQVRADIRAGKRINLRLRDAPGQRHRAAASGLSVFAFYRQSMLAVGWLRAQDGDKFRALLQRLQDNADFEIAFWDVYGRAPVTQLEGFFAAMQKPSSPHEGHGAAAR